jgi:fructose-specific phosphotransferase system component IIB
MALKKEALKRGHEIAIEEQGGHKVPVKLSPEEITRAEVVIIAKMVNISGKNRFENKPILDVSVNKAVINPALIIDQAEALLSSS